MILSKDGARAEIDFDPRQPEPLPQPAAVMRPEPSATGAAMPLPATPVAQVHSAWTGAEDQEPGASALDGDALDEPGPTVGGA